VRDLFLLDPSVVFLNHGSFGACPREVFDVFQNWQRELERNPVEFLGRRSAGLLDEARKTLAGYLGAKSEHLVFVSNATAGVNTVARSIPLRQGDEILTTDHEYGACSAAWNWVCERSGARIVPVEIPLPFDRDGFADRVFSRVTDRTLILYLSHITSTTALIFPIEDLVRRARAHGILTVIDGAHVPGHIPLDLDALGADFYTGNCHKWLCAPKGAAFLHARPEHHGLLQAPVVSWGYLGDVAGHTDFDSYTGATVLERRLQWQGTRDLSAFLTVPSAISFQERHGWRDVRRLCHELAGQALARTVELTGLEPVCSDADFGQMVVLPVPRMDPMALKSTLFDRYRIEVPVTAHGDRLFVRISIQGYNTQVDVDALMDALTALISPGPFPEPSS
jgi:isopenicillin-N epimerase